jgi:hypothetical protein
MSERWTSERIGESHIFYIKLDGEQLAAADEPTAKAVIDAGNKVEDAEPFKSLLRHISELHCGVKVEGEVTLDMVPAFVEGQIDKQSERADHNQNLLFEIAQLLEVKCDETVDQISDLIRGKIVELRNRPAAQPRQKWREPVEEFLGAWSTLDIAQRINELAPFVKKLRELVNGS